MKLRMFKIGLMMLLLYAMATNCTTAYASETTLDGMDVSDFQGDIDFSKAKEDVDAVIIRVASGSNFEDTTWEANYENAKAEELYIGFYQSVTATTVAEGKEQAEYFYNLVKDKTYDFGLVMDFETLDDLSKETINEIAKTYLETLETLSGQTPILYSDVSRVDNLWDESLAKYPLWVAEYGVDTPSSIGSWSEWFGFQYSDTGRINGIDGDVDLDFFKSSYLIDNSDDDTDSSPSTYTIKPGDTLWAIANEYDTTISTLVRINNIANPDLIYPGEQIILTIDSTKNNTYTVKAGDTLGAIALEFDTTVSTLVKLNKIDNPDLIYPNEVLLLP